MLWYQSSNGQEQEEQDLGSGAYIFRPQTSAPEAQLIVDRPVVEVVEGPLVKVGGRGGRVLWLLSANVLHASVCCIDTEPCMPGG